MTNGNGRAEAIQELETAKNGYAAWQADLRTWGTRTGSSYRNITGLYPAAPEFAAVDPAHLTVTGLKAHAEMARSAVAKLKDDSKTRGIQRYREGYISRTTLDSFLEASGLEKYEPMSSVRVVADVHAVMPAVNEARAAKGRQLGDELAALLRPWLEEKGIKVTEEATSFRVTIGAPA